MIKSTNIATSEDDTSPGYYDLHMLAHFPTNIAMPEFVGSQTSRAA